MSTATPAQTAPVDFAAVFYDETPEQPDVKNDEPAPVSAQEPGPAATPEASAASTEAAKPEAPPKGQEAEKGESKKDEGGHMAAARRLGQEVADLKRDFAAMVEENRILKAKLEGTYEEPPKDTPEQAVERAEFKGRETAAREIAIGLYGKEALEAKVYGPDSEFKKLVEEEMKQANGRSWSYLEVRNHPQPPVAAMRVIARREFTQKYGDDPVKWVEKIQAELEPKILEKFKTQAATPVTGTSAPSVTEARGSGGRASKQSIEEMFYGKA